MIKQLLGKVSVDRRKLGAIHEDSGRKISKAFQRKSPLVQYLIELGELGCSQRPQHYRATSVQYQPRKPEGLKLQPVTLALQIKKGKAIEEGPPDVLGSQPPPQDV